MKVDEALVHIGEFGVYQKRTYILLVLTWILSYPFMISSVFFMEVPDHRCKIPGLPNDTFDIQGDEHEALINKYIPKSSDKPYDECHVFSYNQSDVVLHHFNFTVNASRTKCTEWVYSTNLFYTTVVSENNLVCDNSYLVSTEGTVYFLGVLLGSSLMGALSDLVGRRKTLLSSTLVLFISSLAAVWVPTFIGYASLRFIMGFANIGMTMSAYVIGLEWVGPSKRTMAGIIIAFLCPFGQLYITMVSYFIRKWNYTEIAMAVPVGILCVLLLSVPESPRWLLSKGAIKETENLLERALKVNGNSLPENEKIRITPIEEKETARIWLIFTSGIMFMRTVILFCNWVVIAMAYYALTFNVENLYGDFFLNFTIMVLVSFPAGLLPIMLIDRFGRRKVHSMFMMVGGVACLSTILTVLFLDESFQWVTTLFAMIGKFFVAAAFASVYIVSAEIFPTVVRNAAMGLCSSCSWIGAMVAPFIVGMAHTIGLGIGAAVPLVIIGVAALLAGVLTLFLPETLHKDLPETIEDAVHFLK